ncbi:hypothetical protein COCCADRAFT_27940 [Bipolaris zeicola 26-R-13]|uniref:Uncharacterized protein n=1 Tax=Cochliobolus carbonum (strain 26-R-13) TaxID=930089 RepID=W6Y7P4_COCC2|nr:uncharacterized protein COCCADRAFT_27940 [Bipolaris zeicola 26-R-13]EUC31324.1 hypothetical protein COCCADRAFT_27940 [Bipolaris zeicola 26-R-13]
MIDRGVMRWWAEYEPAAKRDSWDDDIWRIWQEEHGVRIAMKEAEEEAEKKAVEREGESKTDAMKRRVDKIGPWATNSKEAADAEMRQAEDKKRRLLVEEEERDMRQFENAQVGRNASEVSLSESFMTMLELSKGGAA